MDNHYTEFDPLLEELKMIDNEKIMKQGRNSAFELMRIVAMFMVVLGHCVLASAMNNEPYLGTIDNLGWFIAAFTGCAVNMFFLLTGYYSKAVYSKYGKTIKVWLKTIIYSCIIYIVLSLIKNEFALKDLVGFALPVLTKKYWYMQVYVVLAFISPYMASLLDDLDKKKHLLLIIVLLSFFSLHESFIKVSMTLDQTQGYGIAWGTVMFIIGSYIRRYGISIFSRINKWLLLFAYIICSLAIFCSNYLIVKYNIAGGVVSRGNFYAYNSVSVFSQSLILFLFFVKLSEQNYNNSIINNIGKNTLAVYLISAHPYLLYPLWTQYFNMERFADNPILFLIFGALLSIVTIVVCIIVDKIIEVIFCKPFRMVEECLKD